MLITIPTAIAKNIFLTSNLLYITVLALVFLLASAALGGNNRPYVLVPTLLLLPGLPPSPTFVSKLWATNMFSFGVVIPLTILVVIINIYLIVTYSTFFIYQTEMPGCRKSQDMRCDVRGVVVVWALTAIVLLNPITVAHH